MSMDIERICQDLTKILEEARKSDASGIIVAVGLAKDDGFESYILGHGYLSKHMGFMLGSNLVASLEANRSTSTPSLKDADAHPFPELSEVKQ